MTAVLSLGSNVGDRLAMLRLAVELLQPERVSSVWESAPVGGVEQDDFLNAVVLVELSAVDAWERAVAAESAAGRTREVRWGPRTLDVDVIWAAGADSGLTLPHPRAFERAFVLLPWLEVDPAAVLPGHGPVALLPAARCPAGLRPRPDLALR